MSRFNASTIILLAWLQACNGLKRLRVHTRSHHGSIVNQDEAFSEGYANLLLGDLQSKDNAKNLGDSQMTMLASSIQDFFQGNTTDTGNRTSASLGNRTTEAGGSVNHSRASTNVASNTSLKNASATNMSQVNANKTKVIEEATPSLPMASFALDDTTKNQQKPTPKPFPGNASQKLAWESKEKFLENEVKELKARLANASQSLDSSKKQPVPAATGTFNARSEGDTKKPVQKFMDAKGSDTMMPIHAEKKPAAPWPSMAAVASPVGLLNASASAIPPQTDAVRAQTGEAKKPALGATFTGTPPKKVASILALETAVDQEAVSLDDVQQTTEDAALASTPLGWLSSIISWFSGEPVTTSHPLAAPQVKQTPSKALMWVKQDSERTATAANEEHQHILEVNDAWRELEQSDLHEEDVVRSEDAAERHRAETVESPHKPTATELKGRHGPQIHGFWGALEKEDETIQQTVQSDDLVKMAELEQDEDSQVSKASAQLDNQKRASGGTNPRQTVNRLAIHEPWLTRENKDRAVEQRLHDDPDLQMFQLRTSHHQQEH